MADINRPVWANSHSARNRRFVVGILKGLTALLAVFIILGAAENSWFGYMWRSAQLFVQGDDGHYGIGNSPDFVLDNGPVRSNGALTVLAVGDIVSCPEPAGVKNKIATLTSWAGMIEPFDASKVAAAQTVELARNWPNAPILALGDIVYRRGTSYEFEDCFDPIWDDLSDRTLPSPGNHEYYTPGAYAYYDYWGQQAGPERRGYYAIKHNNWLILSLNSEVAAGPASEQGKWLTETLDASPDSCILAYYHRPAYSSQIRGGAGSEAKLFAQLAGAGADIILNGHNHLYERTSPMNSNGEVVADGGTVSFVVGTGGRSAAGELAQASFTEKAVFGAQGLLRLELRDSDYAWAFHAVDGARILDEGHRKCGAP